MPARGIVIVLDAAEVTLLEHWVSEGKLPTFESRVLGDATAALDLKGRQARSGARR